MEIQGNITIQLTPREFKRLMSVIEDYVHDYVSEYARNEDLIIEMYNKMRGLLK